VPTSQLVLEILKTLGFSYCVSQQITVDILRASRHLKLDISVYLPQFTRHPIFRCKSSQDGMAIAFRKVLSGSENNGPPTR
jgi:hypothetical protein